MSTQQSKLRLAAIISISSTLLAPQISMAQANAGTTLRLPNGKIAPSKIQAAQEAWAKQPELRRYCFQQALEQINSNTDRVIHAGVLPDDPRLSSIKRECNRFEPSSLKAKYQCNITDESGAYVPSICNQAYGRFDTKGQEVPIDLRHAIYLHFTGGRYALIDVEDAAGRQERHRQASLREADKLANQERAASRGASLSTRQPFTVEMPWGNKFASFPSPQENKNSSKNSPIQTLAPSDEPQPNKTLSAAAFNGAEPIPERYRGLWASTSSFCRSPTFEVTESSLTGLITYTGKIERYTPQSTFLLRDHPSLSGSLQGTEVLVSVPSTGRMLARFIRADSSDNAPRIIAEGWGQVENRDLKISDITALTTPKMKCVPRRTRHIMDCRNSQECAEITKSVAYAASDAMTVLVESLALSRNGELERQHYNECRMAFGPNNIDLKREPVTMQNRLEIWTYWSNAKATCESLAYLACQEKGLDSRLNERCARLRWME